MPCFDKDGDGIDTCSGDCDDNDANVFPGQQAFFVVPRANSSFDYDCDGEDELRWTDLNYLISATYNQQGHAVACDFHAGWTGGCPVGFTPKADCIWGNYTPFGYEQGIPKCGILGYWGTLWALGVHMPTGLNICKEWPPQNQKQGCR
jgi:hypothetical protein